MYPTQYKKNRKYIKVSRNDALEARDLQNVTQIDGGIVDYVRQRMGCEIVTSQVVREAVAFEKEMSRMQGW